MLRLAFSVSFVEFVVFVFFSGFYGKKNLENSPLALWLLFFSLFYSTEGRRSLFKRRLGAFSNQQQNESDLKFQSLLSQAAKR